MLPSVAVKLKHIGQVGLEPTWVSPADFKSAAYANSATAPQAIVASSRI